MKITRDEYMMWLPILNDYEDREIKVSDAEEQWIHDTFARMYNVQKFITEKVKHEKLH